MLRFPFQKRMKNDTLTKEASVIEKPADVNEAPSVAGEYEPTLDLAAKVEQLEAKLNESERARVEQSEELRRYLDEINRANRESSAGSVKGTQSDYFSFSEVKQMTPEQVRKNFSRIVDSMGKWN